jgi:hypothetical protein
VGRDRHPGVADTGLTGTTWDYTDERTDLNTLVGSPSGLFIQGSEVPPEVPSLALQAEYLFDSDTTNLPDTTGAYDGTITGALYRPCHLFPYRLQFANGDRVDINHALDLASFSVAVWWRANSAGRRLVDTRGTGTIGVVKGFQIKNYNTGSNDYCVADDGAGNYIMLEPSASPLSKNPIDGDFHLFSSSGLQLRRDIQHQAGRESTPIQHTDQPMVGSVHHRKDGGVDLLHFRKSRSLAGIGGDGCIARDEAGKRRELPHRLLPTLIE